jgi:ribosomal protein S18 acetylase RimI-like enzyme
MPEQPMDPVPPDPVTAIVFRSIQSPPERSAARRLMADSGIPPAAIPNAGDTVLYGLWDLATQTGEGLVGVAATQPSDAAGSVELCGIAIRADLRHRGLGRRLVTEVANALRAEGATRLAARLESDHGPMAALLMRAGFAATTDADGQSAGTGVVWRYLAL